MSINRRHVLKALAYTTTAACLPIDAAVPPLDVSGGRPLGDAYLKAHPDTDLADLRRALLPTNLTQQHLDRLRDRVRQDFEAQRTFQYRGWRISETEAQLFALLTRA